MKGVAAYIEQDDEETRLIFDDVESEAAANPTDWKKSVLYTFNVYSSAGSENLGLSKEQYAEIGENLMLRLLALNGRLT